MRQYFLTIPKDFEEAAKLDGAGYFKTFWKVMLPLAGPALAAVTILEFQGIWNDFFWPLVILGFGNPNNYTIQMGITQFVFQYQTLWPQLMAASVIAILPIALLFVIFQRYFIAGVVASGVKGWRRGSRCRPPPRRHRPDGEHRLRARDEDLRRHDRRRRPVARDPGRRVPRPRRAVGLRQDDRAADARRPRGDLA